MANKKGRRRRRFRPFKLLFTLVLLAVIVLVPLYFFGIIYPDGEEAGSYPEENWMAQVEGNRQLSTLNLPGTADSAARYVFPSVTKQTQLTGLEEQLKLGYRVFDLHVRIEGGGQYQKLVLCTGGAECRQSAYFLDTAVSLSDAVITAREYMENHPAETVVFILTKEKEEDDPAVVQQLVSNLIEKNHNLFYTANRIPNLDAVRGKIVLCRRYEDALELGENFSGLNFCWPDQHSSTVLANAAETFYLNTQDGIMVQNHSQYDRGDKWMAARSLLDEPMAADHMFVLNSLHCESGMLHWIRWNAKEINEKFTAYTLTEGNPYGIFMFDYADSALASKVIHSNTLMPKEEPAPAEAPAEEAPAEAPPAE